MDIKQVFSTNVRRIIVESYNLCNRKCFMCPQSLNLRPKQYIEFPTEQFTRLLNDLKQINYSETFAFGRYHEPLMFIDITLQRIQQVRETLPDANILLNTNGDYLNTGMLKYLSEAGLSELKIMRYQESAYSDSEAERLCSETIDKLGLIAVEKSTQEGVVTKYRFKCIGNMKVSMKSENYLVPMRGCDRGGLLKQIDNYKRSLPCDVPMKNLDVDYNGNILPCNNLLSDAPQHQPYVIGNLGDISIFEAYMRSLDSAFTKRLQVGDFSYDQICQKCSYFYHTV